MAIRIAINGYGRIGRNILRALYETQRTSALQIIAINDLGDINAHAHLTRYDTVHGRFSKQVRIENDELIVDSDRIKVYQERNPAQLPWKTLDIDIVLECTGFFTSKEKASMHLEAGAKKVIISAPGSSDVDATIVYGVNHHALQPTDKVISNASCTTNCLAPVAKTLHDAIGIESGLMTTVHAYTSDQMLTDAYHSDMRRARAATHSMIPTKTGAAAAVGLVLPELAGKLDGFAIRVPIINVSVVDLTFNASHATSIKEINEIMQIAANGPLKGILRYNIEPLVSVDFNHDCASSVFDATQTRVMGQGKLVKVLAWYDNEWGFSNRMLDTATAFYAGCA